MDEDLQKEFRNFWTKFFNERRWTTGELAKSVGVRSDVVCHWRNGDNAIGLRNVSKLLETGILQPDEAAQLMRMCLRHAGFSETSLSYATDALAGSANQQSHPERPLILALSPLIGETTTFYTNILRTLTRRAEMFEQRVLHQSIPVIQKKRSLCEYYHALHEVSGVVAIACHVEGSTWLEECKDADIPIVLIHDGIEEAQVQNMGKVSAIWEHLGGLEHLMWHLTGLHKCRHLRVIVADPSSSRHRQRKVDTILREAKNRGVTIDEQNHVLAIGEYTYEEGVRVAEELIMPDDEVEAVICLDDGVALAVLQTAKHHRRQDLKVTGYDDTELAKHFGITTINLQRTARAQYAFDEIQRAGKNTSIRYPHFYPITTSLERRMSCGCH